MGEHDRCCCQNKQNRLSHWWEAAGWTDIFGAWSLSQRDIFGRSCRIPSIRKRFTVSAPTSASSISHDLHRSSTRHSTCLSVTSSSCFAEVISLTHQSDPPHHKNSNRGAQRTSGTSRAGRVKTRSVHQHKMNGTSLNLERMWGEGSRNV